jgi:dihydropyrimidinase
MQYDLLVRGGTVVLPDAGAVKADKGIVGERIAAIMGRGEPASSHSVVEAHGLHVIPGAVDSHTHWGYRGDFGIQCRSDSRAAAIGGVTTALLLHRFQPEQFADLRRQGETLSTVDFAISPAIFNEATAACIEEAVQQWGCVSFKFYLAYRRIPGARAGDDWNELCDGLMIESLARLARYRGTLACVHAENAEIINRCMSRHHGMGREVWLRGRRPIPALRRPKRFSGPGFSPNGRVFLSTSCIWPVKIP